MIAQKKQYLCDQTVTGAGYSQLSGVCLQMWQNAVRNGKPRKMNATPEALNDRAHWGLNIPFEQNSWDVERANKAHQHHQTYGVGK